MDMGPYRYASNLYILVAVFFTDMILHRHAYWKNRRGRNAYLRVIAIQLNEFLFLFFSWAGDKLSCNNIKITEMWSKHWNVICTLITAASELVTCPFLWFWHFSYYLCLHDKCFHINDFSCLLYYVNVNKWLVDKLEASWFEELSAQGDLDIFLVSYC